MGETDINVTNEILRGLLTDAFSHEELITLCFDRFPELYEDAKSWSFQTVIRELIGYVKRRGRTADLLEAVKQRNPEQYERYTAYLAKSFYFAGPGLARITVEIPNDNELIGDVLRSLAGILEVQGRIHCVKVEMGSVKLTIILPAQAIDLLLTLYEASDKRLAGLEIGSVALIQPDLRGIILRRADLRNAQLGGSDLRDADLYGAYLNGANLSGADLEDANLGNAKLVGADLHKANLWEANLINADLRQADLRGADLRFARLSGANLTEAVLQHANLKEVDLDDGQLYWANMSGASVTRRHMASVPTSISGDVQGGTSENQIPNDDWDTPMPSQPRPRSSPPDNTSHLIIVSAILVIISVLGILVMDEEPTGLDMIIVLVILFIVLIPFLKSK